jgi:hypothetical protein
LIKPFETHWGHPLQGLDAHVQRYRNSPVMSESVPDECKPLLLQDGLRVPFPLPTKQLRTPRRRGMLLKSADAFDVKDAFPATVLGA